MFIPDYRVDGRKYLSHRHSGRLSKVRSLLKLDVFTFRLGSLMKLICQKPFCNVKLCVHPNPSSSAGFYNIQSTFGVLCNQRLTARF